MILSLDGQGVLYEQIARSIKRQILNGSFRAGMKLPSTRALALILKVSRRSVVDAYDLLATEGLAQPVPGVGTVIATISSSDSKSTNADNAIDASLSRFAQRAKALPPVSLVGTTRGLRYSFQYGAPLVNPRVYLSWTRKLTAAAKRTSPDYGTAIGHPALRAAIANYLTHRRGVQCTADDVLIVSGTQQAISLATRVLLNEGDIAAVEDPFYELSANALTAHGAKVEYVRTDKDGLCVNELPETARIALVTPAHQFPSGVEMSMQRQVELLSWAQRNNAWILEDNYDSEFHGGRELYRSLYSLDMNDRVIYIGSFSKSLFPSIRLGYVVCPKRIHSVLVKAKMLDDLGSPVSEQAALATFMQSGLYEKQLRASIQEVIVRRKVLVHELQRTFKDAVEIGPYSSGMHLVLWFPKLTSTQLHSLIQEASNRQVHVQSIEHMYKQPPSYPGLLLGYASMKAPDLRAGVRRLAEVYMEMVNAG